MTAGDTVLRQLLRGESGEAEWAWLTGFRRRWLVVEAGQDEWRLRVPLMQRWLRERG